MAIQFYNIASTGQKFAVELSTGQVTPVAAIPAGAPTITWTGAGLPPAVQNGANNQAGIVPTYSPPAVPSVSSSPSPGSGASIAVAPAKTSPARPETASGTMQPGGTPYFMGDYALIKFQDDPDGPGGINTYQTWLMDPTTKTIRPFANQQALLNIYGDPVTIQEATKTVNSADLNIGGAFQGFQVLPPEYIIKEDGSTKQWTGTNASDLQARYGQDIDNALEQDAHMLLGGFLKALSNTNSNINPQTIDKLNTDPTSIGFYISALAYGGYTLADIYRDVKRREFADQGHPEATKLVPISSTQTRQAYQNDDSGRSARTSTLLAPPTQLGGLDATTLNLSIYNLPDEAFKTLIPILDPNSPEFKQQADQVLAPFFDILVQQLGAQTEQEKALADYAWQNVRGEIERQLGISLSNNALEAWDQIQKFYGDFAARGVGSSGLQAEAIDDYLKRVRMRDQQNRETSAQSAESKDLTYYTNFATPQQIKDFAAANPDKAKAWGLLPSNEVKNQFSLATLKAKYPGVSDETLQKYISSVLDENGNYRSDLYQKYLQGKNMGTDAPSITYDDYGNPIVTPGDSGIVDVEAASRAYKEGRVYQGSLAAEEKTSREFTTPDSPFLRAVPTPSQAESTRTIITDPNIRTALNRALTNRQKETATGASVSIPNTPVALPPQAPSIGYTPARDRASILEDTRNKALNIRAQLSAIANARNTLPFPTNSTVSVPPAPLAKQQIVPNTSSLLLQNNPSRTTPIFTPVKPMTSPPTILPTPVRPAVTPAPSVMNTLTSKIKSGAKNVWGGLQELFKTPTY